jgi:hypothetical protein
VSLELGRLDTSKPCDSHAIVMRKRMPRGRAAGTDVACSVQKERARASAVLPAAGVLCVNATKSKRWRLLERLPARPCSDLHSRHSPGDRWSELSSHTAVPEPVSSPSAEARTHQFSGTAVRSQRVGSRKTVFSRDGLRSAPLSNPLHQSKSFPSNKYSSFRLGRTSERSNDTDPPVVRPTGLRNSCPAEMALS